MSNGPYGTKRYGAWLTLNRTPIDELIERSSVSVSGIPIVKTELQPPELHAESRGMNSMLRFDVGVDADNDRMAVDAGFGFLVAVAAGDGERLAGGGRTRRMQRDFNVEDVVLDGGFHG